MRTAASLSDVVVSLICPCRRMVTDLQLDVLLSGLTHLTVRHSERHHRAEQAAMLPRLTALQSLTLDDNIYPGREAAGEDAIAKPDPTP